MTGRSASDLQGLQSSDRRNLVFEPQAARWNDGMAGIFITVFIVGKLPCLGFVFIVCSRSRDSTNRNPGAGYIYSRAVAAPSDHKSPNEEHRDNQVFFEG